MDWWTVIIAVVQYIQNYAAKNEQLEGKTVSCYDLNV